MDISVTYTAPAATAQTIPDFPLVRFDSSLVVYQEALIAGQYLGAVGSAMGRPKSREWVWNALNGGEFSVRPLRRRQTAFQLEVDGQLLNDRWEWAGAEEVASRKTGNRELVVRLKHTLRAITVEVHTRLDDTPFLTRWLVITNTGPQPAAIADVAPWSGQIWEPVGHPWITTHLDQLSGSPFCLGRFTENWPGGEGCFNWLSLPRGGTQFESLNGKSGWGSPFFILRNEVSGEYFAGQLAWSGNWEVDLFQDDEVKMTPREARLYAQVRMAGPAPLRVLEPGETAATPEVHLGFMFGGLDALVQALHTHQRRSVILAQPAGKEHRVEVNHTGYTRNAQVTQGQLKEEIDMAADVGVELFLLDAGWFGKSADKWWEAVGDWDVESPLLPEGVKGVFDYAGSRGLLRGLWVEAERLGPASQVLKQHPEMQTYRHGVPFPVLDLAKPEVEAYFEKTIIGIIQKYELDCFRIDYNAAAGDGGDNLHGSLVENNIWRYYDALYRVFDHIHVRFPDLLLENCSSGGGRTDMGIMSRFHYTQITDCWSPGLEVKLFNGMSLALPPELAEIFLGGISDGIADIDFMLRMGLFGHFCASGIFPTLKEQQSAARQNWMHAIQIYKDFVRPILSTSRLFHHSPVLIPGEPGTWAALESASQDRKQAYAGVFRLGEAQEDVYHFVPRGLDPEQRYQLKFDNSGAKVEVDGWTLQEQGVNVRLPGAFTSELLLLTAIGEEKNKPKTYQI